MIAGSGMPAHHVEGSAEQQHLDRAMQSFFGQSVFALILKHLLNLKFKFKIIKPYLMQASE